MRLVDGNPDEVDAIARAFIGEASWERMTDERREQEREQARAVLDAVQALESYVADAQTAITAFNAVRSGQAPGDVNAVARAMDLATRKSQSWEKRAKEVLDALDARAVTRAVKTLRQWDSHPAAHEALDLLERVALAKVV